MRRLLNDRTHYATAVGCTHDGRQQLKQIANLVGILYTNSIRSCLLASFVHTQKQWRRFQSSGVSRVGLKGGFQKSQIKRLVKIGASKGVTPLITKKYHGRGGGGFPGNQKTTLDTPLQSMPFYASLRTRWFVGDGGDAATPSPKEWEECG